MRRMLLTLAVVAALAPIACGGDNDKSTSSQSQNAQTTKTTGTTGTTGKKQARKKGSAKRKSSSNATQGKSPASSQRAKLREQRDLVTLLDALQALARGDAAAAIPRERLDLTEIVGAAVESARRRHPDASIELAVPDGSQELEGWPDGLRVLAENLIENAVRHGGSHVVVALDRENNGPLRLSVEDDGPGVPEDERESIFERFARGSGAKAPGSGLGLALVAQQAALHGGSVAVGEASAGGARFTVTLP